MIFLFDSFKWPHLIIQFYVDFGCDAGLFFFQQHFKVVPEQIIVYFAKLCLLCFCQVRTEKFPIYNTQKLFFLLLIKSQFFLKWPRHIRHITFACIMQQTCQYDPI